MCKMREKIQPEVRKLLAAVAVATVSCLAGSVHSTSAATLRLPEGAYPYSVVEQDLSAVLREFGHNVGVYVDISPKVQGRMRGRVAQTTAKDFLDNICESYALEWYFDGYALHISTADEKATRFLSLRTFTLEDLSNALRLLGFFDERYPLHAAPSGKTVIASGPPRYVDLVEQTLLVLPHPENLRLAARTEAVPETVVYRAGSMAIVKFAGESKATESKK